MKIKINDVLDEFLYRYADEGGNFDDPFLKIVHDLLNVGAINTSKQYVDKTQNNRHDLTNDEIIEIRQEVWDDNKFISEIFFDFARAILRKAQEK